MRCKCGKPVNFDLKTEHGDFMCEYCYKVSQEERQYYACNEYFDKEDPTDEDLNKLEDEGY